MLSAPYSAVELLRTLNAQINVVLNSLLAGVSLRLPQEGVLCFELLQALIIRGIGLLQRARLYDNRPIKFSSFQLVLWQLVVWIRLQYVTTRGVYGRFERGNKRRHHQSSFAFLRPSQHA